MLPHRTDSSPFLIYVEKNSVKNVPRLRANLILEISYQFQWPLPILATLLIPMEPKSKLKLLKIRVRKIFSSLLTRALKLFFEAPFLKQIIPKRKLK